MATKGKPLERTKSGHPTAKARKEHGEKKGKHKGSFPISDKKSADDALDLRRGSKARKEGIERRAAKYDPAAAKRAREADKKKK